MKILGIIPSRYASTRFPGKPLTVINGKTMIQRVYEQAAKASLLDNVVVATDDSRIAEEVKRFGGKVVMTSSSHRTGTDRCAETAEILMRDSGVNYDAIINIQGDEPFIDPGQINQVAMCFNNEDVQIATLALRLTSSEALFAPSIIKIVANNNNKALYFSRSPIPYLRGKDEQDWINYHTYYKHIGIYGYRTHVLQRISTLEQPSSLETAESLEQLRWMQNGIPIHVEFTEHESVSIDTPDDLLKLTNNA
ncbi:MAG: 3-deoxy-manno-octulosonate cytidylyltransferase [Lentimicrobiaceae bacterium]|nr:3-deoxy-manno-octulosonate cytidylyltransferase [Lentimicrobiaceae bacterium]